MHHKPQLTFKNEDRDFHEWHQGVTHYGLWAFIIKDEEWTNCLSNLQKKLSMYLHDEYQRQPHITVFTCGLLPDGIQTKEIDRQAQEINKLAIKPFLMEFESFHSFLNCPALRVRFPDNSLTRIRTSLNNILKEDRVAPVEPHATIGLYNGIYSIPEIFARAQDTPVTLKPLLINEISYCVYETKSIKGPLQIINSVTFN